MNKSGAIQVPAQVFKLITYFHLRPLISCYTLHSGKLKNFENLGATLEEVVYSIFHYEKWSATFLIYEAHKLSFSLKCIVMVISLFSSEFARICALSVLLNCK